MRMLSLEASVATTLMIVLTLMIMMDQRLKPLCQSRARLTKTTVTTSLYSMVQFSRKFASLSSMARRKRP